MTRHDHRTLSGNAWSSRGEGAALLFTNGIACPTFYWDALQSHLEGYQRINWDLLGHGESDPAPDETAASIESAAGQLLEVQDAAGVETATWFGFSLGVQIVLEAMRQAPERCERLVLALGAPGHPFGDLVNPLVGPLLGHLVGNLGPSSTRVILRGGYLATRLPLGHRISQRLGFVGRQTSARDMEPFYQHLRQIDPGTWAAMARAARDHDATDVLHTITVPTLIIAGSRDRFTPGHRGVDMARAVDDSELLLLPEATHTGLLDERDAIASAVTSFLLRRPPSKDGR